MANTGFKGIDVRQTGLALIFDGQLQDSSGNLVTTGTTSLRIYEIQSDGTLRSYDFGDHTFKSTALGTETQPMTHRTGNNGSTNTGYWSFALSTLTGFTVGGVYMFDVSNSGASPVNQKRKFVYGSAEGDVVVTASGTGAAYVQSDLRQVKGTASQGQAGYVALDWGAVANANAAVDLSNTTFKGIDGVAFPPNFDALVVDAGTGGVTVKLNTDKAGYRLDLTQAIPASNTGQTLGDALNAARAQGFGKWILSGTTLTLYAADGTTAVRTFSLDSATAPTQRS